MALIMGDFLIAKLVIGELESGIGGWQNPITTPDSRITNP